MMSDLSSNIRQRFPLEQYQEAIDTYLSNQTAGKILLQPGLTGDSSTQEAAQHVSTEMKLLISKPTSYFQHYSAMMTADYCEYPLEVEEVETNTDQAAQYPQLEIGNSKSQLQGNAIAGYIAKICGCLELTG